MKVYDGKALGNGGTSISGKVSPAIVKLVNDGKIPEGSTIIDYGAGKSGRNAVWLREQGYEVYAFDPFNGTNCNGWEGVSDELPDAKFDLFLTCFVLNVVNIEDENIIVTTGKTLADRQIHITRNRDIAVMVKDALESRREPVTSFYTDVYGGDLNELDIGGFCIFGTETSRGFQRIPQLGKLFGFMVYKPTFNYTIFMGVPK